MSRANAVLLVLFLALFGAILVVEKPFAGDEFARAMRREHPLFPDFDGAKAGKIEIRAKDRAVEVDRGADGAWTVPGALGYRADTAKVGDLFDRILGMRVREPLSDNPENREKFNVGEEGILVKVSDAAGRPLAEFIQGKFAGLNTKDPDFDRKFSFAAFVRRIDSSEVHLIENFMPLGTTPPEWIDASLVRFEPTVAKEFTVEGPLVGGRIRLAKEGEAWKIAEPEPGPARTEAAAAWVTAFASTVFKEVVAKGEDPAKWNLAQPLLIARARTLDGKEYVLRFGTGPDGETYYGSTGEGNPWVYTIHGWTVTNLKKTLDDFREPPAEPPSPTPAEPPASEPAASQPGRPG